MKTYIALALVLLMGICLADDPKIPQWPNQFTQAFTETMKYPVLGSHHTSGTYYYDWTNKRARTDRDNGQWDRYCGANGTKIFKDTPCTQLVVEGVRWIIYPDHKECCNCCSDANGCGVVIPTWMQAAEFQGQDQKDNSTMYKWIIKGGQDNYYWETMDDEPTNRAMYELYQESDDDQVFDVSTWSTEAISDDIFALPDYCDASKSCSFLSVCNAVNVMAMFAE